MTIYDFMSESPWLTFFLALAAGQVVVVISHVDCIAFNRAMRHWNIRRHGYPPAHCDADGDFRPENDSQ